MEMELQLTYKVRRGRNVGATLTPHRHKCGRYVVSPTRYKRDYRYYSVLADVIADLKSTGDSLRMSDKGSIVSKAPSLIRADRIDGLA